MRRVIDRKGHVVEDHSSWDDPWLDGDARLDRVAATMGIEPKPVIEPRTAYLTSKLLREIVTTGHSAPIRATKVLAAGKTGTSSRTSDVWFVGYTSRWMATAWLGDDKYERQLGYKDASFMLSVPMWARFMYAAVGDQPLEDIPWERPPQRQGERHRRAAQEGVSRRRRRRASTSTASRSSRRDKLKEQLQKQQLTPVGVAPPKTLVPQKTVRVQSAVKPDARHRAQCAQAAAEDARRRRRRRRRRSRPSRSADFLRGVISSSREVGRARSSSSLVAAAGCSDAGEHAVLPIGSRCSSDAQCGTAPYDCATTGYPYGYCEKPCTTDGDCPADSLCSATAHACRRVCTNVVDLPRRRRLQLPAARRRQERLRSAAASMDGGSP